jgi:hypothetical protein
MIQIGAKNWIQELKSRTEPLGPDFWSGFTPGTEADVRQIETRIQRKLDGEFCEFYRAIGHGNFRNKQGYGGIYTPDEIVQGMANPIYFITGSMTPGAEWASLDRQIELWLSRGQSNPDPTRFTEKVLTLDGVKLYDLLQIGSDGMCGYHQLYVGLEPAPLRYCLLTEVQEMEDRTMTFSAGVEAIIRRQISE